MNIKEKIKELSFPNMKKGIERFPITVLFGVVLFVITSIMPEDVIVFGLFLDTGETIWGLLLSLGIPIVTTFEIIREKYFLKINKFAFRVLYLLLSICFLYLCKRLYSNVYHGLIKIEIRAIGIIGCLIFLLVPLIGRKNDKEKYILSVLGNSIITMFFIGVFYLGVTLVITLINILLINLPGEIYIKTFLFINFIFGIILFVSRLKGVDEDLENYEIPKIIKILLSYIIIPIIVAYSTILYVYMLKIIFILKMPKGIVSHLVVWYMIFSLFIIVISTPLVKENVIVGKFRKFFPIVSIPLIIIAFISILSRVMQYGVTENRYIIIILIFWLLFNMIFYIIKTDVRVVIISTILVVFVSVFGPWNMTNISINSQSKRLERILVKNGLLKNGKLEKNSNLSNQTKRDIMSIVNYFYNYSYNDLYKVAGVTKKLKSFEENGKFYSTEKEFMEKIGADDSWNIEDDVIKKVGRIVNINEDIHYLGGYDYILKSMTIHDGNSHPTYSTPKHEIKINDEEIIFIDKKSNEEIIKINTKEVSEKAVYNMKDEIEKGEEFILKVNNEKMIFKGENENIKYKVEFISIDLYENYQPSSYNINLYFTLR